MSREAIIAAINKAGSQQKLAESLGNITQQAVGKWLKEGVMPIERAAQVQVIYGIPARDLADPAIVNLLGRCPNCDD